MNLTESAVEEATLGWSGTLGYAVGDGPQVAPVEPAAERDSFGEVELAERLREALLPKPSSRELSASASAQELKTVI